MNLIQLTVVIFTQFLVFCPNIIGVPDLHKTILVLVGMGHLLIGPKIDLSICLVIYL